MRPNLWIQFSLRTMPVFGAVIQRVKHDRAEHLMRAWAHQQRLRGPLP
jgi:hypothetical protein